MISAGTGMSVLVEKLLGSLDEEIALLEEKTVQLASLRRAMLDRDDQAMAAVLTEIEQDQRRQDSVDLRLSAARRAMANAMGIPAGQLRLSRLIDELPPAEAASVDYRRQQILLLAERARKQHLETAILLHECSRINRMLLEGLFPQNQSVTTYGQGGSDTWRPESGLMDTEH
jgi:hypothetical protein